MKNRNVLLTVAVFLGMISGLIAQNVPSYVPTNGLVGWWPFNGNANDESGNGNNGTVKGAILGTDRFNNLSKAYHFDGDSSKIEILPSSSLNNFNNSITISVWIFNKGRGGRSYNNMDLQGIFGPATWLVDDGGFLLRLFDDNYDTINNRIINYGNGLPNVSISSSQIVQKNSWEHVTCSYDGNIIRMFRNGNLTDSAIVGSGLTSSNNTNGRYYTIGQCIDWSFPQTIQNFNGKLDDIGIWSRALTKQEIKALYQGGTNTANCVDLPINLQQGLVGYWPFCGNALDESGYGNHGTVNGAALTTDRFGNEGSAYSFDGVTSNVQIPNSTSLSTLDSITISAWVKINSWFILPGNNSNFFPILNKSNTSENGKYSLYLTQNNGNAFQFGNQNLHNFQFSFGLDSWYHIACRFSGGQYKSFVNGVLVNGNNFPFAGALNNNLPLVFGKDASGEVEYSNGSLDDIAIWNRALSQSEITQLYNQGICKTSITVTDTLLIHTGITSYNPVAYKNTLKVWPNPGNQDITIDAGNLALMQGWKIRVSNAQGVQIYPSGSQSGLINQQQQTLDMSGWGGNGLYFLYLIDPQNNIQEVKKIVLAP